MKKRDTDTPSLPFKKNIRLGYRLFQAALEVRPSAVIGFFIGSIMEIGGSIAIIYATAKIGGILANFISTGQATDIWLWVWVNIFVTAITAMGFFVMSYAKRMLYFSLVRWSINSFLNSISHMDIADFYDKEMRNKINKVSGAYIWQIPNLSDANLDLIYGLLRFAAITAVVSQITWWIVPLIALFLIPSLIAESRLARLQWFVWDSKGDERHIFFGLESIFRKAKAQMEIRSTQASHYLLDKIDSMNVKFYDEQQSKYRGATKALIPTKLLEVVGTAIGEVVLVRQVLSSAISLDRFFFLSGALIRIGGALNNIFGTLTRMQEGLLFADSYFSLVDAAPKIIDDPKGIEIINKKIPGIVFENVSFTYPGQDKPVFTNLNLAIKSGEHVALVGENGAGKSTLIKLLLRFYVPNSGRILIDGHDLNKINIESWYAQLATLFQEFNQYPLPIDENITIGRSAKHADKKQLEQAAKFGGVDEMIGSYEHGWDTVLDSSFKKGVEPSGGQWQRVAIARAFYRDANMIVLDEPTSAIDAKAEYEIFNSIFEHYKDKTSLIVSHRFSTVRRADRIVVMDNGAIVEEGSHESLMKNNGLYHELFSKQAEGYK